MTAKKQVQNVWFSECKRVKLLVVCRVPVAPGLSGTALDFLQGGRTGWHEKCSYAQ